MINCLKKLMPLILADLIKKQKEWNDKIKDVEDKISRIIGLATTAAPTAVEN